MNRHTVILHRRFVVATLSGIIGLGTLGCTGGSGGAGFPNSGPVQSGGAVGAVCTPGFHTVGCLIGGNARMGCDGASQMWKQLEACAAGTICLETVDAAGTRSTTCQATPVVDASTSDANSNTFTSDGGSSSDLSSNTIGDQGTGGSSGGTTSSSSGTTSSSGADDAGGSSSGTTSSSSGTTSSSGADDAGSSGGTTSSSSSSGGVDAGPTGPDDIANPNVKQTPTPIITPEAVTCPASGTKQSAKASNVTVEYHVELIGGVEKLNGPLTWKTDTATLRKMCLNANKIVGNIEVWDSDSGQQTYVASYNGNGQRHGASKGTHKNGQKRFDAMWDEGERTGFYEVYNDQGIKTLKVWFDGKGELGGLYESWHDNGQTENKTYYKSGDPHGISRGWHDDGGKEFVGAYNAGLEEGTHTWWSNNQSVVGSVLFKQGNGNLLIKHDNGKTLVQGQIVGGKRHGPWLWYDASGVKTQELAYTLGNGTGYAYHPDGTKYVQVTLKDGSRHGYWKFWDDKGQLTEEGEYDQGNQIGTWVTYNAGQVAYKLCYINGVATVVAACKSSWLQ